MCRKVDTEDLLEGVAREPRAAMWTRVRLCPPKLADRSPLRQRRPLPPVAWSCRSSAHRSCGSAPTPPANRLRVLAAAERLFAERGVGGVTMDDVAAAAGVGKGT